VDGEQEPSNLGGARPGAGAPPGNHNAVTHGVNSLIAKRRHGKIDKRTSFGRAFEARKKEYLGELADDVSVMLAAIVEDTVWTEFYIVEYDRYLASLKSVIRKGRPHPIVEARTKLAAHKRENIRIIGLERRHKVLGLDAIKERYRNGDDGEQPPNGAQ
jgi:hypothetical protein